MNETRIIGHKTLTKEDLNPKHSPAFSPNLFKYLKKNGHFFTDGGLLDGVYTFKSGSQLEKTHGAGKLLLGDVDGAFFSGVRLIDALCNGNKAERASFLYGHQLVIVDHFWDNYLKLGRCAIDPDHQENYLTDRFVETTEGRTCLWCNHAQRKVVTPRIEYDTTWVSSTT